MQRALARPDRRHRGAVLHHGERETRIDLAPVHQRAGAALAVIAALLGAVRPMIAQRIEEVVGATSSLVSIPLTVRDGHLGGAVMVSIGRTAGRASAMNSQGPALGVPYRVDCGLRVLVASCAIPAPAIPSAIPGPAADDQRTSLLNRSGLAAAAQQEFCLTAGTSCPQDWHLRASAPRFSA